MNFEQIATMALVILLCVVGWIAGRWIEKESKRRIEAMRITYEGDPK